MSARKRKSAPRLLSGERRREIVARVERDGRVTVDELARHYGVSAVTIRTDLEALARAGALSRSHGGALPRATAIVPDEPINAKAMRHHAQKRRIAQAAARLIRSGDTIILDSGSTTAEIAKQIRSLKLTGLTVITNALNIAQELAELTHVRVIMLGGMLRPLSRSLVGSAAEQALTRLHADRLFLGVDGIDATVGITTPDQLEATLNASMIHSAGETIAVADASKLGRRSLSVIAPVNSVRKLITDQGASAEQVAALRAQGIEVELV
jgi:DeoR family transcriptional regulator of aga operon